MKRILASSLVAIVAMIVSLLAGELYLRRTETHIVAQNADALERGGWIEQNAELLLRYTPGGRRLVPNARVIIRNHNTSGRDVPIRINSIGFRGPDVEVPKPAGVYRILVIGDSITWADYLPEEETYVRRIEQFLAPEVPDLRIEAINAGIGDVGTREQIELLEEIGLSTTPDLVVLAFYLNDSRPSWGFAGELGSRGWLRRNSLLADVVYRNLKLRQWIGERGAHRFGWQQKLSSLEWQSRRDEFRQLVMEARYDWGAAWSEESWAPVEESLRRLATLSAEHGFRVAIVVFPVAFQVYAGFVEDLPQRRLGTLAQELGFLSLDLLPMLRHHADRKLFFDQCHPTPFGNELIGGRIAGFLRESIFPDDRVPTASFGGLDR